VVLAPLSSRHSEIAPPADYSRVEHQPGTAASSLDVAKDFVSSEAIQRQLSRMMARPIPVSFATAINDQLADAVRLE